MCFEYKCLFSCETFCELYFSAIKFEYCKGILNLLEMSLSDDVWTWQEAKQINDV